VLGGRHGVALGGAVERYQEDVRCREGYQDGGSWEGGRRGLEGMG